MEDFDEIDEKDEYITLTDDDGEEFHFEQLDVIEMNGNNYCVLLPFDDTEGEVIILQIVSDDDSEFNNYIPVEDDSLLERIFEEFKNSNDDFDFID